MSVRVVNWTLRFFMGYWTTTEDVTYHVKKALSIHAPHNPDETPHDRMYDMVTCLQRCNINGDPFITH